MVPDENAGVTDALQPVQAARARAEVNETAPPSGNEPNRLPMMFTRKPNMTPILVPEYRYCYRDHFTKPLRAHHCRACGTVSSFTIFSSLTKKSGAVHPEIRPSLSMYVAIRALLLSPLTVVQG